MSAIGAGAFTAGLVLLGAFLVDRLRRAARAAQAVRPSPPSLPPSSLAAPPVPAGVTRVPGSPRGPGWPRVPGRPPALLHAFVQRHLRAADIDIDARVVARRWALGAVAAMILAAGRWGTGGVVVALAVSVGGPVSCLAWRRGREARRFAAALPGLLESVAGKLRAGAALPEAVATSAADSTGSASLDADLRALARRVDHGLPFTDAVEGWAERHPAPGVGLVAAALVLGADAGGARARALDGVATTLRDRRALAAEVDALSSQARASAVVMIGAPVVFAVLGLLSDPEVSAFVLRTPAGIGCLVGGLALDAAAGWWMMRIAGVSAGEAV